MFDFRRIVTRYLYGSFLLDMIPTVPISILIPHTNSILDLLFLIKLLRMKQGLKFLDAREFIKVIFNWHHRKSIRQCKDDPDFAEDVLNDHNKFGKVLVMKYLFNTAYLIIMIFNISFLVGMLWIKFILVTEDLIETSPDNHETFRRMFLSDFESESHIRLAIVSTYFSFTSLSTVGFGDLFPIANHERLVGAFILLFGVAIFSFVMQTFTQILNEFQNFHMDIEEEEADSLSMFLHSLNRMNGNIAINEEFRHKIEHFFDYRWKHDRNSSLAMTEDQELFEQLPQECRDQIYFKFLFSDFLKKFKYFFSVEKNLRVFNNNPVVTGKIFMTWQEQPFREYVVMLLTKLEPRFEHRRTIIYDELEDVNDLLFVHKGKVVVGYEINKQKKYTLVLRDKAIIGDNDVTFGKKSEFIYTALTNIEGFFIRNQNWQHILRSNPDVASQVIIKIAMKYIKDIQLRVVCKKNSAIERLRNRPEFNVI